MGERRIRREGVRRSAILCAFAPELPMLEARLTGARRRLVNGLPFVTGRMAGRPCSRSPH